MIGESNSVNALRIAFEEYHVKASRLGVRSWVADSILDEEMQRSVASEYTPMDALRAAERRLLDVGDDEEEWRSATLAGSPFEQEVSTSGRWRHRRLPLMIGRTDVRRDGPWIPGPAPLSDRDRAEAM